MGIVDSGGRVALQNVNFMAAALCIMQNGGDPGRTENSDLFEPVKAAIPLGDLLR
jgi:hypothetical protein